MNIYEKLKELQIDRISKVGGAVADEIGDRLELWVATDAPGIRDAQASSNDRSARTVISTTPPAGEYLTALSSRFCTTCNISSRSPLIDALASP